MIQDKKTIIENESSLSLTDVLILVKEVVKDGKVSDNGTQYACATVFEHNSGKKTVIFCQKNKSSYTFTIVDHE